MISTSDKKGYMKNKNALSIVNATYIDYEDKETDTTSKTIYWFTIQTKFGLEKAELVIELNFDGPEMFDAHFNDDYILVHFPLYSYDNNKVIPVQNLKGRKCKVLLDPKNFKKVLCVIPKENLLNFEENNTLTNDKEEYGNK